jgi:hypothetical protein
MPGSAIDHPNEEFQPMSEQHRVLPLLLAECAAIDALFIQEVGPFGQLVVAEAREKWLAGGRRVKSSDIVDYIALLAREIPEPRQRSEFIAGAREIVGPI